MPFTLIKRLWAVYEIRSDWFVFLCQLISDALWRGGPVWHESTGEAIYTAIKSKTGEKSSDDKLFRWHLKPLQIIY